MMLYLPWLLAIPVVLLLLWQAWRRPARQRLPWRLLASALAGLSLVLLVFPPTYRQTLDPGTAILLTEGYAPDTLQALLQANKKATVYTYQATAADATPVADLYTLRQQHPALSTLHVLGQGLDATELAALQNIRLIPHLSALPAGITAVQWPEQTTLGEDVTVSGKYKTAAGTASTLYLQAAGQRQDSVKLSPGDSTYTFRLRYTPKLSGRFTYTLLAKSNTQTDTLGLVPVQVTPDKELGILLLAAAPSFEFKFLKNHLGQLQHRVALRATISKGMNQSEWLNMPQQNLSAITPKLLQGFDVVITEQEALQSMSAAERGALQRAVTDGGLGVLTVATAPAGSRATAFFTGFETRRLPQQPAHSTRALWASGVGTTAAAAPYTLLSSTTVTGLVRAEGSHLLAGARQAGWGKVALSFLPQTFNWQLEGKEELYASYWAGLLSAIAREEVTDKFWQRTAPQVPLPNKPVILTYTNYCLTGGTVPPAPTVSSLADSVHSSLPLAQDPMQPTQFSGTFWPRHSGWHQVHTAGAPPYFFYVQDAASWPFEGIYQRRQATQAFVAQQGIKPAAPALAHQQAPISPLWFFVLFVLSSGFLWLEEKF